MVNSVTSRAYQLCILPVFQVVSQFLEFFNFTDGDGDGDGEKWLVGLRLAAPQAKTLLIRQRHDPYFSFLSHFSV